MTKDLPLFHGANASPKVLCSSVLALFALMIPCGCSSGSSQTTDPTQASDATYTVVPSVSSLTIYPGSVQTLNVGIGGKGNSLVTVSLTGLPSGITVTSSPASVLPGGSVTLTLSASANADAAAFPATSPINANSASTVVSVSGVAGSEMASAPLTVVVSLSNTSFTPAASDINLPIVNINTNGVPVTSKTTDVSGTISITSADGSTTYLPGSSDTDNTATFHVHGNSTAGMPKLPYEMKLGTSVDLLGLMGLQCGYVKGADTPICDKSKTYVLLANYDDKSLLHDWAASALANAIPYGNGSNGYLSEAPGSPTPSGTSALVPWAPHSLFVEVFLNGQYEGNYQLIEKVNVDSHRVNIPELTETDTSGDLTGGYLLEIDQTMGEAYNFVTPQGVAIGINDPDFSPDPEVPAQTAYITQYVDTAENAMFGAQYTDPTQGWRAYFDEASLVNFYIVNDVMGNVDGGAFYSSDYLYKTVDNPLLYMGPVWDFDIGAGNVNYQPIVSPTVPWMQVEAVWYKRLFTDPGFAADVQTQWNTLQSNGVLTNWVSSIQQQSVVLTQSAQNNFTRWPMVGETVWPNPSAQTTYAGSVSAFTDWVNQRIGYLDSVLNGTAQSSAQIVQGPVVASKGDVVTYAIHVQGASGIPSGAVKLLLCGHVAGTGNLNAAGDVIITATAPVTGKLMPLVVYSGDRHFAIAQAAAHDPQ